MANGGAEARHGIRAKLGDLDIPRSPIQASLTFQGSAHKVAAQV